MLSVVIYSRAAVIVAGVQHVPAARFFAQSGQCTCT